MPNNASFICVACASDRSIVASCSYGAAIDLEAVKRLLDPEQMQQVQAGTLYHFTSGTSAWHLVADEQFVYVAITALDYPQRYAQALIEELRAAPAQCKSLHQKLLAKYDDVAQLGRTVEKVESVKMMMQDNIEIALSNCVSLDAIDRQSDDLRTQASVFKTRAKKLRNMMWWKRCKTRLVAAAGIFLVLVIVIVPNIFVHNPSPDLN